MPARLENWDSTKDALHRASDVLGKLRKAFSPKLPNALHLALLTRPWGLTTGALDFGGSVDLRWENADVRVRVGGESTSVALTGKSPAELRRKIVDLLRAHDVDITALPAIEDDRPFELEITQAAEYGRVVAEMRAALLAVRGDFLGAVTPLVVWPHGFDLSMIWFPGTNPDEHSQPHVNLGFSPGSAGLPRPYLYGYVSPLPNGLTERELPAPAHWNTEGWTGAVLGLDDLPDGYDLEAGLRTVFHTLADGL